MTEQLDSYGEPFSVDLEPIIDDPESSKADPRDELVKLKFASPKRDWLDARRYQDVEEALATPRDAGEANNLACAQAWLAWTKKRPDYWANALDSLEKSKRLSESDPGRADFNIERVKAARTAAATWEQ